jgi:hypothetical protein
MQDKINNLLGLDETRVAEHGMRDRKRDGPKRAGRLHHIQSELILVGFNQRCNGTVDQLVVRLLLGAEAVMIMGLLPEPKGSEKRKDLPQPFLKDYHRSSQPLLKAQGWINLSQLVAGALAVEGILDDGIDQGLLCGKGSEDRPLRYAGGLRDLPRAHLTSEPFQ